MIAKDQDPKPGANRPGIIWGQRLGRPECPYMRRWVLNFGLFAIRLHHWCYSDDPRHLHDHSWWFATFVLKGGYTDVSAQSACVCDQFDWQLELDERGAYVTCATCGAEGNFAVDFDGLRPGSIRRRSAYHTHTVWVDPGGCWTLLLTGREKRRFGYWVRGKWINAKRYFRSTGMHPCED